MWMQRCIARGAEESETRGGDSLAGRAAHSQSLEPARLHAGVRHPPIPAIT